MSLSKAAHTAKVARTLLRSGLYDDAVSRAYYAAFHCAKALIAQKNPDYKPSTHAGTLSEFSKIFVKTGLMPSEFGKLINRAHSARQVADYEGDAIGPTEAETYVAFAEDLLLPRRPSARQGRRFRRSAR